MAFTQQGDSCSFEASIEDMKLIYRVLHRHMGEHLELMDCDFMDGLQAALQHKAQQEGVDIAHHGAWDLWLGNDAATPCEERVQKRTILGD